MRKILQKGKKIRIKHIQNKETWKEIFLEVNTPSAGTIYHILELSSLFTLTISSR